MRLLAIELLQIQRSGCQGIGYFVRQVGTLAAEFGEALELHSAQ